MFVKTRWLEKGLRPFDSWCRRSRHRRDQARHRINSSLRSWRLGWEGKMVGLNHTPGPWTLCRRFNVSMAFKPAQMRYLANKCKTSVRAIKTNRCSFQYVNHSCPISLSKYCPSGLVVCRSRETFETVVVHFLRSLLIVHRNIQKSHPRSITHLCLFWLLSQSTYRSAAYCWFLIFSKCLMTVRLASRNRSTQFCAQVSSPLSSFPLRIVPVTHFFQQVSVRECIAV